MKSGNRIFQGFCCCWMLLFSCSIFTPRDDFEPPAVEQPIVDIYNFGSLLSGTGEVFSKLDWYELFDDSLKYINVRSGSSSSNQTELISHLNQQKALKSGVRVSWAIKEKIVGAYLITLNNVGYTITTSSVSDSVRYSGSSRFVIRRDTTRTPNIWRILGWTDDPTSDTAFFAPAE